MGKIEKNISLSDFMKLKKPDNQFDLLSFKQDIIHLYSAGYSLKSIYEYVHANGYQAKYNAFTRWLQRNLDLKNYSKNTPTPPISQEVEKEEKVTESKHKKRDSNGELTMEEQRRITQKYLEISKRKDAERDAWKTYKPSSDDDQKEEKRDNDGELTMEEQRQLARKYLAISKQKDAERDAWRNYKPSE